MSDTHQIRLDGNMFELTTSITHLGNYIRNELSESDEYKQCDFIGTFNGHLAKNHDAIPDILMQLTSSYFTHLCGSQVWQLNDTNVPRIE